MALFSVPRFVPSFLAVARGHYLWDWLLQIKLRRFDPGCGQRSKINGLEMNWIRTAEVLFPLTLHIVGDAVKDVLRFL
jgi:hypothetical protein